MDRPCPSLVSKLPVLAVSQSGFNAPVFESGLHKSPHFKATWRSTENRVKSGHSLSEFEKVVLGHIRVKGFWLFTWREPQKLARIQKTDIYGKGEENPGIRQQSGSSQCSRENAQQILPGRHEVQKKNSFQLQINIYTRGQRLRLERGQNTTSKKEGRGQSSQQIQRQTLAKGREADLTEHRRTSQVKSRGEGMGTLATDLAATPAMSRLCVKQRGQRAISQSSKLWGHDKLQDVTGRKHRGGRLTPRKAEAVFISAATYFFPVTSHVGHIPPKAAFHACGFSYSLPPGTKHLPGKPGSRGSSFFILFSHFQA